VAGGKKLSEYVNKNARIIIVLNDSLIQADVGDTPYYGVNNNNNNNKQLALTVTKIEIPAGVYTCV
jgi:hypothetical protein